MRTIYGLVLALTFALRTGAAPFEEAKLALPTSHQLAGDRRLAWIARRKDAGQTCFEASYMSADIKRTCIVSQEGKLASVDTPYEEVPAVAQRTAREKAPGAGVVKVEKVFEGPALYYGQHLRRDGKPLTLEIGEDGKPR